MSKSRLVVQRREAASAAAEYWVGGDGSSITYRFSSQERQSSAPNLEQV
jgi:hypothetical protein